jgi:TRAP-type mannitol/chloroaromatic compound transport system substrate-binding protein
MHLHIKSVKLEARVGIATGLVVVGDLIGEGSAREQSVVGGGPQMLAGATAAVAAAGSLRAPAIAQGIKELNMVTSWPKDFPGLQTSAERLARSITAMSDGRLKVTVYPAGSLVRPFEVFDAVGAGAVDMYHSSEVYNLGKSPALVFFASAPYGMTADEVCSWVYFGGGRALWDEVDAQFNQYQAVDGLEYRRADGRLVQ